MASQQRPDQGHSRHASADNRRVAMPRRTTRGPLDMEAEIEAATQPPVPSAMPAVETGPPTPALETALPPSPALKPTKTASTSKLLNPAAKNISSRSRSTSPSPRMNLDLSPLLRAAAYSPIPTTNIAGPFLASSHEPSPNTPLQDLLLHRRFRHAAIQAAKQLTSGQLTASNPQQILSLYHTRLASLVLSSHPTLASKEAKLLSDIVARESHAYTRPSRDVFVNQVPWSLRLLLLRLQTLASADSRRGVMALYALASECRALATLAKKEDKREYVKIWKDRLRDLGVRVAGELIEMGEVEAARRHLTRLDVGDDDDDDEQNQDMLVRKTLLYLRLGDVMAAETCISTFPSTSPDTTTDSAIQKALLEALTELASSNYSEALSKLQSLHSQHPTNALICHNLAIAHLYNGDVTTAAQVLDSLVAEQNTVFPTLLFNLATLYELRTERARESKLELVDMVAGMEEGKVLGNWERDIKEFKLG